MNNDTPTGAQIARMKKVLELARRGEGGEKTTAETMLKNFLAKYNMTLADLEDQAPAKRMVTFRFRGDYQRRLLMQIVGLVLNTTELTYWKHRAKSEITFELTPMQYAEIDVRFEVYKPALCAELEKATDRVFSAFVQLNRIAPTKDGDDDDDEPIDMAELEALFATMRTMKPTPVHAQIGGPDDESAGL